MGQRDEVLIANAAFYRAFARADAEAMNDLWASDRDDVTVVHPGAAAVCGRADVIGTWARIFEGTHRVDIRYADAEIFFHGDVAIVVCSEFVQGHGLTATNVFCRTARGWRIVHHHAGPCGAPKRRGAPGGGPVLH